MSKDPWLQHRDHAGYRWTTFNRVSPAAVVSPRSAVIVECKTCSNTNVVAISDRSPGRRVWYRMSTTRNESGLPKHATTMGIARPSSQTWTLRAGNRSRRFHSHTVVLVKRFTDRCSTRTNSRVLITLKVAPIVRLRSRICVCVFVYVRKSKTISIATPSCHKTRRRNYGIVK